MIGVHIRFDTKDLLRVTGAETADLVKDILIG
jgi:hypothetical protein